MSAILSVNCGSSTVKLALFQKEKQKLMCVGRCTIESNDFDCFDQVDQWLSNLLAKNDISLDFVGHRIVHGGHLNSCILDAETILTIKQFSVFSKFHAKKALSFIQKFEMNPYLKQYCCFDTSFHQTIPKHSRQFPIPKSFFEDGVMRYGFHGIAYQNVLRQLSTHKYYGEAGIDTLKNRKIICLHLGGGCSVCGIKDLKSITTSMGLSVLDGVIMGTRPGRLDPGLVLHLLSYYKLSVDEVEQIFYKQSGLKAMCGTSDMKAIEASLNQNPTQDLKDGLESFIESIKKELFSIIGILNGIDIISFSGGIGENSAFIRKKILDSLEILGFCLDENANYQNEAIISNAKSKIKAFVVNVDEEFEIASQAQA